MGKTENKKDSKASHVKQRKSLTTQNRAHAPSIHKAHRYRFAFAIILLRSANQKRQIRWHAGCEGEREHTLSDLMSVTCEG